MPGFISYAQDAQQAAAASTSGKSEPIQFVHFGIRDMSTAESLEELSLFVNHLKQRVHNGEVLYCHCWGGKGRAGLVSACLLGALYEGMTADEALERVQTYCSLRNQGGIGTQLKSPETDSQKEQVREYYALRS
jgi:protein-tyrosine phosphatase